MSVVKVLHNAGQQELDKKSVRAELLQFKVSFEEVIGVFSICTMI
jgi:hypothetical protein